MTVDLTEQNNLINKFKTELGMNITATYDIVLNIEIEGIKDEVVKYSPGLSIEVGNKTSKISGDNNVSDAISTNTKEFIAKNVNKNLVIILSIIAVISLLRIMYLTLFTREIATIKNTYKSEINDILRSYQDKMVMVNSRPQIDNEDLIEIENIEELIKLSEELFKPILCYENDDETETEFIIMSEDAVYKYITKKII